MSLSVPDKTKLKKTSSGFSLLELAMALVMLGIFLVMFQGVFKQLFIVDHRLIQIEKNRILQGSIETYLSVNSRLPCPDTDDDGREDFDSSSSNVCDADHGGLPFDDFGVEQHDAWGNPYFYQVLPSADDTGLRHLCTPNTVYASSGPIETTYAASGNLFVHCSTTNELACSNTGACPDSGSWNTNAELTVANAPFFSLFTPYATSSNDIELFQEVGYDYSAGTGTTAAEQVIALVVSYGANGDEAYFYDSSQQVCPSSLPDIEKANCDADSDYQFVKTQTGLNRDYLIPITLTQAKKAVIQSRRFR